MTSTQVQLAVLELAKKRGMNPAQLSPAAFRQLALEVSDNPMGDVKDALKSRVTTTFSRVSDATIAHNAEICEACPHGAFVRLKGGEPACGSCGCSDKFLKSKWADKTQHCPITIDGKVIRKMPVRERMNAKPTWDNRNA